MSYFDHDLTDRAVRARRRWLKSLGYLDWQILQPCRYASRRKGKEVILANVNGVLARYRIVGDRGRERLLRTFPETT